MRGTRVAISFRAGDHHVKLNSENKNMFHRSALLKIYNKSTSAWLLEVWYMMNKRRFRTDLNSNAAKQGITMLLCCVVTQNISFHCRSYGRPAKKVKLKAHFVRLSEGMLVDVSSRETYTTASSLHKQPFFHIYWTDCQVKNCQYPR